MVSTIVRAARSGTPATTPLAWAPPALSSPTTITVTDDPTTRRVNLGADQDAVIVLPSAPITEIATRLGTDVTDAMVHVTGGRHVAVIGGHFRPHQSPPSYVTQTAFSADTTIRVDTTAGFPEVGELRIDGEAVRYTGLTATSFTGCTRNAGFFNNSAVSTLTHAPGARVYLGEYARSGLSFFDQTGTIHVEGVLFDGFLGDGIRALGKATTVLQVQNCRIGPAVAHDRSYQTDAHPDCIQILGTLAELRMHRVTMMSRDGACLLNQGTDGGQALPKAVLRDVLAIAEEGNNRGLFVDRNPGSTIWDTYNTWASPYGTGEGFPSFLTGRIYNQPRPPERAQPCPPGVAGTGYRSPGYL